MRARPEIDWQIPRPAGLIWVSWSEQVRVVMAELAPVTDPAVAEPVGLFGQVVDADTEPDPDDDGGDARPRSQRRGGPGSGH